MMKTIVEKEAVCAECAYLLRAGDTAWQLDTGEVVCCEDCAYLLGRKRREAARDWTWRGGLD